MNNTDLPDFELLNTSSTDTDWELKPVLSEELEQRISDRIPTKTKQSTSWSMNVWKGWTENRNCNPMTGFEEFTCVPVDPETATIKELDFWLSRFIMETRRQDGTPYPPNTLLNISAGIQRHLREMKRSEINVLQKNSVDFPTFQKALDTRMKEVTAAGLGIHKKRADAISPQDEDTLWCKGVISLDSAEGLSYGVFYYNCKLFGCRGMDEHRDLDATQFEVVTDSVQKKKCLTFYGRISKNNQGGLFSTYLSLIPKTGPFYRRPIGKLGLNTSGKPKFSAQVVGVNKLSTYIKTMFDLASIDHTDRNISNHSGKVTCVTTLYDKGFDNAAVTSRSGHRSNAVETYKRQSVEMNDRISKSLQPPLPISEVKVEENKENEQSCANTKVHVAPITEKRDTLDDELVIHVPKSVKRIKIVHNNGKVMSLEL
ncbi:unnamed protein product [Mytilus coruscus]|uniref:QRICH1-like domain-containing protein n=1 Tax=Mytilus coruscus TaxID=42192 RepID=A0A6J8DEU7_MYTCO|nr:unnamed protein product [Mytilus coruscus]